MKSIYKYKRYVQQRIHTLKQFVVHVDLALKKRCSKFFLFFYSKMFCIARMRSTKNIIRQFSSHAEELLISASRGQPLIGATSQTDLVIRLQIAGILTNQNAVNAMSSIDRSKFINQAKEKVLVFGGNEEIRDVDPFDNKPQPLGHGGATISTPQFHGEILQALSSSLSRPSTSVLDIGTGTGYMACVFAQMVGSQGDVVAVDAMEPLIEQARSITDSVVADLQKDSDRTTTATPASITFKVADDWHLKKDHQPTFDTIYCAPAVSSPEQILNLSRLLHLDGVMVVPLNNVWTGEQRLLKVTKKNQQIQNESEGEDSLLVQEDIGPVACQPVLEGEALVTARQPPLPPPLTRTEELNHVKKELAEWTLQFTKENGSKPTREDLMTHSIGGPLFQRFTNASKIGSIK